MNPMLLKTPAGMIDEGMPNQLDMGMIPVMMPQELSLPPVGDNYEEIRNMPMPQDTTNPMLIAEQEQPPLMPNMNPIMEMFRQPSQGDAIGAALGLSPQRQAGLNQFIQGLQGMQDAYNRANLPASIYLKMKEQEDDAEIKRQAALVQSLQLESDLNFQRQTLEMKREELAMQRQQLLGEALKKQRVSDILGGGAPVVTQQMPEMPVEPLGAIPQDMGAITFEGDMTPPALPQDNGLTVLQQLAQADPETYGAEYLKALNESRKPQTEIGRLQSDFEAGRISKEQFDAQIKEMQKTTFEDVSSAQKNYDAAQLMLDNINALLDNEKGFKQAVGTSSYIPVIRGTLAADFLTDLEGLKGKAFLQAFEQLKGAGAITEKEGEAATKATAILDTSRSEDAFKRGLEDLKQITLTAQARAAAKLGKEIPTATAAPRGIAQAEWDAMTPEERKLFE